jgi:hypothetical protein
MTGLEIQDVFALAVVAVVVGAAIWRRASRRTATSTCGGCGSGCGIDAPGSPPDRVALDLRPGPHGRRGS